MTSIPAQSEPSAHLRIVRGDTNLQLHGPRRLGVDEAYRRYSRYVATVALRLLGRQEEVQDVVHDVFCVLARRYDELEHTDELRGWLAGVTTHIARRRLQKRRMRSMVGLDAEASYTHVCADAAPSEARLLLSRLYRVLDALPVGERIAWSIKHLEEQTLDVVAARLGISPSTAKRRIARAHRRIARELGYAG